ncbi:MAG: MobF family relaxase [Acidimicrobiales bacterium]
MLNIGRLRADAVAYYVDAVADSSAAYYFGQGEAPGRWAGSLAPDLGLDGAVDRQAFERLLGGLHPLSGEVLVSAAGSNARALSRSGTRASPAQAGAQALDVAQVAAQLQVSTRSVRHWLDAGERAKTLVDDQAQGGLGLGGVEDYQARLDHLVAAGDAPGDLPATYLLGARTADPGRGGHRYRWAISQDAVDRLRERRRPADARAGWDLVFRPPKSYSVLWAVGPEPLSQDIRSIHHQAVTHALAYLEDAAASARVTARVGDGRKRVRAASRGFAVAAFDHRDSRAGDPLLHTHCVVANVTRLPDGSWAALDPHGLYRHGLAADAVYQATFRHLAERWLGLASEAVVNGWADVECVSRSVVEHFSKRSEEIAAELARVGSDSAAARQVAALSSRRAKSRDRDGEGLHQRWRAEAEAIGFDRAAVTACLDRAVAAEPDGARLDALFDRLAGPQGLTEGAATFSRAEVVAALATALGGAAPGSRLVGLADQFLASDRVAQLREHRPGLPRKRILEGNATFVDDLANASFTTPDLAAIERRLMDVATGEARWRGPTVAPEVLDDALAARPRLNGEQQAMVRSVCRSTRIIRPVVGYPGSGKTYATEACAAAFAAGGVPVIGCAVTAEAADELARATGLRGGACDTVARTLLDLDHPEFGGLQPHTVVVLDEASTISHRDLHRLVAHVERARGSLLMVGDPRQHGAVGPGHFFGWLVNQEGIEVASLRANHRQRDVLDDQGNVVVSLAAERAANLDYREDRIVEAFARRDAAGLVTRAATTDALYDAVVDDWFAQCQAGGRDPMITTRNAVRHQLNLRARRLLDEAGELSGPALEVAGQAFQIGDRVVARENNRRLRSAADPSWWVKNGSRGTVVAVDAEAFGLTIDFSGAERAVHRVRLPETYLRAGNLEWAYALTDYAVQGRTLDRGIAVLDDSTTTAGAYVATTRGRRANHVYLVDGRVAEERDADVSHGPPSTRESGFDAMAARLAAEVPDALLHEVDPWASDAGSLAARNTLSQLHELLAPVEAILAATPPDVSRRIAGAEATEEKAAARRQVVADQLRRAEPGQHRWGNRGQRGVGAHRAELDRIDRGLDNLQARLTQLHGQEARRARYLAAHADEVGRRDLLRDAIAGRETKVRLGAAALVPAALHRLMAHSSTEAGRDERLGWRRALEKAALYRDRWGVLEPLDPSPDDPTSVATLALGARPSEPAAACQWDETARLVSEAASVRGHQPARLVAPDPEPSPAL